MKGGTTSAFLTKSVSYSRLSLHHLAVSSSSTPHKKSYPSPSTTIHAWMRYCLGSIAQLTTFSSTSQNIQATLKSSYNAVKSARLPSTLQSGSFHNEILLLQVLSYQAKAKSLTAQSQKQYPTVEQSALSLDQRTNSQQALSMWPGSQLVLITKNDFIWTA